jgi:SAM-dependent methyltransferase
VSDPATIAFYEANASRYSATTPKGGHRHLDTFLDRLGPGSRILELGCGAGADAAHMIKRGFAVDPTDGTSAMVQAARQYGLAARQLRFEELDATDAYDAVWAHACLIHVPRSDFAGVVARIHRALRARGWHFANFKLGDGEGRDPLGRLTNFPDTGWLQAAYREAGFSIEASETYRGHGADGVVRDWHALTVRKLPI